MYNNYVTYLVNFRKIEFGGSCGHVDRYGQPWQHSWRVCDARSARGDLAGRSRHFQPTSRAPEHQWKWVKINENRSKPMEIHGNQWKSVKIHWFSSILDDDVSRVGELSDLWRSPRGHRGHSGHRILARNVVSVVHTDPCDHRSLRTRFFENLPNMSHVVHNYLY